MNYRPQSFSILPPVIKNLLIINGIFFLAKFVMENTFGLDLNELLGLYFPTSNNFQPFQLVTHMFMHGSFTHVFFNMFALWMFGAQLENIWGPKRFLIFYFISALGGAVLHEAVLWYEYAEVMQSISADQASIVLNEGRSVLVRGLNYSDPMMAELNGLMNVPVVGASGAVFGILLGFGMTFPNSLIYIYFLFPIKAKYFVMIYGALELWNGLANSASPIAHFAHLGGMLFGYLLIRYWRSNSYR